MLSDRDFLTLRKNQEMIYNYADYNLFENSFKLTLKTRIICFEALSVNRSKRKWQPSLTGATGVNYQIIWLGSFLVVAGSFSARGLRADLKISFNVLISLLLSSCQGKCR